MGTFRGGSEAHPSALCELARRSFGLAANTSLRILTHEISSLPSPQLVVCPPPGGSACHAVVVDLTPFGGSIVTWELHPGLSVYEALAAQRSVLANSVADQLHAAQCVCLVNHVVSAPSGGLGPDTDVIHFYLLRNAVIPEACAPDTGPAATAPEPVPAHPTSCPVSFGPAASLPVSSAIASQLPLPPPGLARATPSMSLSPVSPLSAAHVSPDEGLYTVIGSVEGAISTSAENRTAKAHTVSQMLLHLPHDAGLTFKAEFSPSRFRNYLFPKFFFRGRTQRSAGLRLLSTCGRYV